jgi:hypothetical protein
MATRRMAPNLVTDRKRGGMVDLNDAVRLLQAKRQELVAQLEAVDSALAALRSVVDAASTPPAEEPPEATQPSSVVPTKLKPRRTLSDEHQHALTEGRRKARHAKDAAAGHARAMIDPFAGPAPAPAADSGQPRLVKRTKPRG